jgi:hypothetical protein
MNIILDPAAGSWNNVVSLWAFKSREISLLAMLISASEGELCSSNFFA